MAQCQGGTYSSNQDLICCVKRGVSVGSWDHRGFWLPCPGQAGTNSLGIGLDLVEISKQKLKKYSFFFWRRFGAKICDTSKKIVVPDQGENWCRQSWRHKETIDISLHYPVHHPSRDTTPKRFLYFKQIVMRTDGITAMPCSILRNSIRNLRRWGTARAHKKIVRFSHFVFSDKL